jgi:hypothetical protein
MSKWLVFVMTLTKLPIQSCYVRSEAFFLLSNVAENSLRERRRIVEDDMFEAFIQHILQDELDLSTKLHTTRSLRSEIWYFLSGILRVDNYRDNDFRTSFQDYFTYDGNDDYDDDFTGNLTPDRKKIQPNCIWTADIRLKYFKRVRPNHILQRALEHFNEYCGDLQSSMQILPIVLVILKLAKTFDSLHELTSTALERLTSNLETVLDSKDTSRELLDSLEELRGLVDNVVVDDEQ